MKFHSVIDFTKETYYETSSIIFGRYCSITVDYEPKFLCKYSSLRNKATHLKTHVFINDEY